MTDFRHDRPGDQVEHDQRSMLLPSSLNAPAIARQHVELLTDQLPREILETALLAVSEVVANAVLHGAPDIVLEVALVPDELRVSVADSEPAVPSLELNPPSPDRSGGRGLIILDALVDRWGVSAHEERPGKSVWFTLALG
jgi:anti-sigma regulatory factor (Ser/Thr protein kinase)